MANAGPLFPLLCHISHHISIYLIVRPLDADRVIGERLESSMTV